MKVLLVGGGGREHALAWHLKKDPRVTQLFIAPGNAGTASLGTNLPIPATDVDALLAWAEKERPDRTFVGPEAPLCLGLVDRFLAKGFPIFGPNGKAARLESSKVFTKGSSRNTISPPPPGPTSPTPSPPTPTARNWAWRRATPRSSRPTAWPPERA